MHSSGSGPNDPRKISLTVLLSHPATMHGILVVSALLYKQNISNPNVVAAEYYRHMIGAISAVNKALDDPIERYSDAIVGAIMLLARNEVRQFLSYVYDANIYIVSNEKRRGR